MYAVVYTSNTGHTAEYAKLFGDRTGLPVYSLAEAVESLPESCEIVYFGWLMAGKIKELDKARQAFAVRAVCAVGLCESGTLLERTRTENAVGEGIALFTLQGGYAPNRLRGIYRLIMKLVTRSLLKKISKKEEKTESDLKMYEVLGSGGSFVAKEHLTPAVLWAQEAFCE